MISCTLNQYKEGYKTHLLTFLKEYEDNTKSFFLQKEKKKYQAYQKALTKIADQMMFFTSEELKNNNRVHKSIAADLKEINPQAYKAIITELVQITTNERLSLSTYKRDKIIIDEKELENHIKSSIVILKFINQEYEDYLNTKANDKFNNSSKSELEQIDANLWNWLQEYEKKTKEHISIPAAIEEKAVYVIDTYKNYEERNFKYQLQICNIILGTAPNEKIIIGYKNKYEEKLIELRKEIPLPSINIEKLIFDINDAFYKLEKFMEGSVAIYKRFLFNDTFTLFFNELNKIENVNLYNHELRDGYLSLMWQINYDYDNGTFKNTDAYQNEDFKNVCNELSYICWNRMSEFGVSNDLEEEVTKLSIIDLMNPSSQNPKDMGSNLEQKNSSNEEPNPFPQVFTNRTGYCFFEELHSEFKESNSILADFSFIYRMMIKENYILDFLRPEMFRSWLSKEPFNIVLDNKLKTLDRCTTTLKQTAYNNIKSKVTANLP